MRLAGVDGCRGGWIVALADAWPCAKPRIELCPDFQAVLALTVDAQAVAVDIPIGLTDAPRAWDINARLRLGSQRSSIFFAPPRACLHAKTPQEFQVMHRAIRGVGAGLPVWGIVPKMLEVNLAFEADPALHRRVFEAHPELAWQRLNHGKPLISKRMKEGLGQRLALLQFTPDKPPRGAKLDDVLDAIVLLSTGYTN